MVKYRESIQKTGRGRGTLVQIAARASAKLAKEILADARKRSPTRPRDMTDALFDALGLPIRRSMLRRLREGGAMSLTKLSRPYSISLPATLKHVRQLEQSGLISTEKHGRVRICVYNPTAFKDLASVLSAQSAFWQGSFARLERQLNNKRKK